VLLAISAITRSFASPYVPSDDNQVLAELPAGAHHSADALRTLSAGRLDIALSLAQLNIARARELGDMRFLGYAEATLDPWMRRDPVSPQVLILHATILQSRHAFDASLVELDRALSARTEDAQGWLTRATVLRVLGRYPEALDSCRHLAPAVDPAITTLCTESLRGLNGHLDEAYSALAALSSGPLPPVARAWRLSELGEMAGRRGQDALADRWFAQGLALAPGDLYMRAARADVLLRLNRPAEVLTLLNGYETSEPMLLRLTLAHRALHDGAELDAARALANAFELEAQRGDEVHRREQARFLLDVEGNPQRALDTALQNWRTQREPEDLLILCRAAVAARHADAASPGLQFLQANHLQDARLIPLGISR
jgi:predicted Zn-dependent protease